METIFTQGSCYRLCVILRTLYPDARFLYSHIDGHWITSINDRLYDINGEIDPNWATGQEYKTANDFEPSAYVPTFEGSGVCYSKYLNTV